MAQKLKTSNEDESRPQARTRMSGARFVAIVLGVIFFLFVLSVLILYPAIRQLNRAKAREEARSKGRELVSAVQRHHKKFLRLPINRVDDDGNEIRSWRIELLYFLGERQVADMISPTASWDSEEHNVNGDQIATLSLVPAFQSPRGLNDASSITHFVSVTDPDSPMSGDSIKLEKIESNDGVGSTALFLEFPASDISWAEPRDVTLAEAIDIIQNSTTSDGTVVAIADGTAIVVPESATVEDITKLFLLNNGAPQGSWWTAR